MPVKWAIRTLAFDMMDPSKLLTLELEFWFKEFNSRIWAIADWTGRAFSLSFYPFPVIWNFMTKEVLRDLGVSKGHVTDENVLELVVDGKSLGWFY